MSDSGDRWPPPRDELLELARGQRRFWGVPADDETVVRVVDLFLLDEGAVQYGMWLTPDEQRDDAIAHTDLDAVRQRLAAAPSHVDAGMWLSQSEDGRRLAHVAVTADLDYWKREFANVVQRPCELVVHLVSFSSNELETIMDGLMNEAPAWIEVLGCGIDVEANVVEAEVVAATRTQAESWMRERYDDRVRTEWLGDSSQVVEPERWGEAFISPDGQTLTIEIVTSGSQQIERTASEETPDSVRITLWLRSPVLIMTADAVTRASELKLSKPLGNRVLIDATTGQVHTPTARRRPSLR